ncbi:MAG: ATP-binding protein [Micrococcales bacterium]|nr:ATP-binding protein [Micrococcales bacterium]
MVTRWRPSLTGQLLAGQAAILLTALLAVALVSLAQSTSTFERVEGRRVTALAEMTAAQPLVRHTLSEPAQRTALATYAQSLVAQSGVDLVIIADPDERIRVSTGAREEGAALPVGAESVRTGGGWTGRLDAFGQTQLAAQVPVLDDTAGHVGQQLGTVMVGVDYPSIADRLRGASSYLLTYLGIAGVLGGLGSWALARRIKRQTLGLEPHEIAGLAEHREALLHGLAEGVVALDTRGRITLVNDIARRLLDFPEHAVGMALPDLRVNGRLLDVLTGVASDGRDEVAIRHGRVLVLNRMEVEQDSKPIGSVTTVRDRTELADLEREIGAFRSATQVLRAQAHEFSNQLHTISGLIQLGEHDEVVDYVAALSSARESLDLQITSRIRDNAIAALVLAKHAQAAERRVDLRVADDCDLDRLRPEDSADVATVLGNLVDNAVDAVADLAGERWVETGVHQDAATVRVVVRDSGPGVEPELTQEVFTRGFTTKVAESGERGIGLALTRLVCTRRGGEVRVTNTPDGAMFTADMTITPLDPA